MKKKKILILDPANFIGGAEYFMLSFLRDLGAQKNIDVVLVTIGTQEYLKLVSPHIKIYRVDVPRLKLFSFQSWKDLFLTRKIIARIAQKEKTDVILCNSVRANIVGAMVSKNIKIPVVWMMHEYTCHPKIFRFLSGIPAKIICVSASVQEHYRALVKKKILSKFAVVHNGIDLQEIVTESQARIKIPLKQKEIWIGTIGRLDAWKGQKYVLLAAQKVLAILPNARFFFIGSAVLDDPYTSAYYEELKKFVLHHKMASKIYFTGFLKNVYPLVKQLDIVVHSSVEKEPFGRVILDGMAFKKTVIASPLGGPLEIIDDGENGFLVDPKDTIRLASLITELAQDPLRREKIGRAALKKVQTHFMQSFVNKKLLDHVLSVCQK